MSRNPRIGVMLDIWGASERLRKVLRPVMLKGLKWFYRFQPGVNVHLDGWDEACARELAALLVRRQSGAEFKVSQGNGAEGHKTNG